MNHDMAAPNPTALDYPRAMLATSTATSGGALASAWHILMTHGPSWEMVPSLMFGLAALVTAVISGFKVKQDMRQSAELHAAQMARLKSDLATATDALVVAATPSTTIVVKPGQPTTLIS